MCMHRWVLGALLALAASNAAMAVVPESGMYYNPNFQGLGYYIEVQGTTLVMISFAYDKESGGPLFYYAAGQIEKGEPASPTGSFSGSGQYLHEYPYVFDAPLYGFETGPCITCFVPDWNTAEHAFEAGHVHLRMSDLNRIVATFSLSDGSESQTTIWRQGFGRQGYDLGRDDGRQLPSMLGRWVFVDHSQPDGQVWRFNFTEADGPRVVDGGVFHGRSVDYEVRFVDPDADAVMTCVRYGCEVAKAGESLFLVKFWDIGMDSLLGYKGDVLYSDDGSSSAYRGGDLVIGRHVIDPNPEAAPPPWGN